MADRRALLLTLPLLAGCATVPEPRDPAEPATYGDAIATFITDDILSVTVEMGAQDFPEEHMLYSACHAALAMELRGAVFARHVRTLTTVESGVRRLDTVYNVSKERPRGEDVLVADETLAFCRANEIPGI